MYSYIDELERDIRRERARENNTKVIVSVQSWRSYSDGCVAVSSSSITTIYNTIKYTLDEDTANNFIKNF